MSFNLAFKLHVSFKLLVILQFHAHFELLTSFGHLASLELLASFVLRACFESPISFELTSFELHVNSKLESLKLPTGFVLLTSF